MITPIGPGHTATFHAFDFTLDLPRRPGVGPHAEYVVYAITTNGRHALSPKGSRCFPPDPLTPNAGSSEIAFREWVTDPRFYERLVDGDEDAATVFRREKDLIDREA